MSNKQNKKQDPKKQMTRIVCLALAAVMVISVVASAIFSQVW